MSGPGGMMNNMFQGMSGTFQRMMRSLGMTNENCKNYLMVVPSLVQTNASDFSGAVLPQGRPKFNSGFGNRDLGYGSRDHRGIDIGVDRGFPVTSMEKGTVTSIIPEFMLDLQLLYQV